ncbi:MAG: hypothetical protein ACOX9R_08285 [Armatimonadota bacterium]|jgi:hypothetical protein
MKVLLTNDVHGTEVRVRVRKLPHVVSERQTERIRQGLCGRRGCNCGVIAGPQQYKVTRVQVNGRGPWEIGWWPDGEGPHPHGERALRMAGLHTNLYLRTQQVAELLGIAPERVRELGIEPHTIHVKQGFERYTRLDVLRACEAVVEERRRRTNAEGGLRRGLRWLKEAFGLA